jgi:hypothetical protein
LLTRAVCSYDRWWEAYTAVYLMHSKWLDLATEIAAFHYQSKRYDDYKPPSFGANPRVQSLDPDDSEIMEVNDHADLNRSSGDELAPTSSSLSVGGSVVGSVTSPSTGEDRTPPPSPTKRSAMNITPLTPNARARRHARGQTMEDLIQQMDASEAQKAEMNRQSLISERTKASDNDDGDDDAHDCCVESNGLFVVPENSFDQIDSEKGEGGNEAQGKERRSWLRKIKDKRSEAKVERKTKKLEKHRSRADVLPTHLNAGATISRDSDPVNSSMRQQKRLKKQLKRRRSRHAIVDRQPATERLFEEQRKTIAGSNEYALRQERQLEFRDRFDVKTGKPYSIFTAVSRKNLRDGNIDPDEVPPMLFLEECAHLLSLMSAVAFSTLRNDLPEAESPLTVFEPGLPWPLVDPDGYKAKVRKGWTQSNLRLYSVVQFALGRSRNDHARTLYNAARPFRVIGNVSDAEIERLQEARGPLAKVSLISMWLLELISRECQAGSTGDVAAPILSRLYQFVSEGLAGYNQARKIAYIPFPFPHAQITTLYLLVVDFFVTPILMITFVTNTTLGCFLNFFSVLCFTGLHEVAREIENPFQNVPNDVPLNNYQAQFNEGLMVMFYGYHPDAYWDNKQKKKNYYSGTTPSNQNNHGSRKTSATARSDADNHHADFQRENRFDEKIAAVSNEGQLFVDTSSWANNKSLQMPQQDDLTINQPPEQSESVNVPTGKSHREVVFEPNQATISGGMNRTPNANNIISGHPNNDVQTDNFLRALMGNRIDSSSTALDSFHIVPSENDSNRIISEDKKGSPPSPFRFRIPKRICNPSAGIQFQSDEYNSSVILSTESVEEKDLVNRTKSSD